MINPKAYLAKNIFSKTMKMIPTRNGFGEGMVLAGEKDNQVVALTGDLSESTRFSYFEKKFPERYIQVGIAEQNMMGVAAGLALNGKIPYIGTYAVFCPGRNWDQLRISVCYNNVNVNLTGAHSGLSVGPDGATHQALEDIAITRCLPNLTVIAPCDYEESKKAALKAVDIDSPVYIRFARPATPSFTTPKTPFTIGKGIVLWDSGDDLTIVGSGPIVYEALLAARELGKKKIGCKVVDLHTIKPIDTGLLTGLAKTTGAMVVCEEHQKMGGVYSAVCEVLCREAPIPVESIGIDDTFGESGTIEELMEKYGLTTSHIVKASQDVIKRKK